MASAPKLAQICDRLNAAGARYVVMGAHAMLLWGGGRNTRDVDVLIEATTDNARRILGALDAAGFVLSRDLDPADVATRAVTMIGDLWRVDLFTIAWSVKFEAAAPVAHTFEVEGVPIPTMSIPHLIASKRTGRLQDAADIELLEEIARRLGQRL